MHIWSYVHFLDAVCFPDSLHMQYSQLSSVVWYAFFVEQCWLIEPGVSNFEIDIWSYLVRVLILQT